MTRLTAISHVSILQIFMEQFEFTEIPPRTFYGGQRYQHLQHAIEDVASTSSHNVIDIVVIPPDADPQTDDEEFDDNYIQEEPYFMPDDVAGGIELQHISSENETSDEEYDLSLSVLRQKLTSSTTKRSKKKVLSEPKWTKEHVDITNISATSGYADRLDVVKNDLENLEPVAVFEKLFDDEIFDLLVHETNLYSSQKNEHSFFVSKADMKLFVGILLLTGYHKLPSERNYWSLNQDLRVPVIQNAMSRNRFQEIKKYVHLADNNSLDKNNKMAKLRPLISLLNQKYRQWGIFDETYR